MFERALQLSDLFSEFIDCVARVFFEQHLRVGFSLLDSFLCERERHNQTPVQNLIGLVLIEQLAHGLAFVHPLVEGFVDVRGLARDFKEAVLRVFLFVRGHILFNISVQSLGSPV